MIVCTRCGHGNAPEEEFCTSCGAFLEWLGELVEEEEEEEEEGRALESEAQTLPIAAVPAPARRSWISRAVSHAGWHAHSASGSGAGASVASTAGTEAGTGTSVGTAVGTSVGTAAGASAGTGSGVGTVTTAPAGGGAQPEPDEPEPDEPDPDEPEPDLSGPQGTATGVPGAGGIRRPPPRRSLRHRSVDERPPGKPIARHHSFHPRDIDHRDKSQTEARLQCGSCHRANDPRRVLCLHCGTPLLEGLALSAIQPVGPSARDGDAVDPGSPGGAEAPAGGGEAGGAASGTKKKSWTKKLKKPKKPKFLAKLKRKNSAQGGAAPKGISARKYSRMSAGGTAPGGGKLMKVGFALGVVVILLAFVGPFSSTIRTHVTGFATDVRKVLRPQYTPVVPVKATATSHATGHPPSYAIDNVINTSWETGAGRDGTGQSLTIGLAGYQRVDKIGFISGDQSTPKAFRSEARPHKVSLQWSNGHKGSIDLRDVSTFQVFSAHQLHVRWVKITIDSVYPSAAGRQCAIAEVELFKLV